MSSSRFEWLIVYNDYSTQTVIAYSVDDIIFNTNLYQSSENIINITRLELY